MNQNVLNNIKGKFKTKSGKVLIIGFIMAIIIILFFKANNSESTKNTKQNFKNKQISKNIEQSSLKLKGQKELSKNNDKLKITTNQTVRNEEFKKEQNNYKKDSATVLKTKYSNASSGLEKKILKFQKEKELKKKELIDKNQQIEDLKQKIKKVEKEKEIAIKNKEIVKNKENITQQFEKKNIFSKGLNLKLKQILISEALEDGESTVSNVKTLPNKIQKQVEQQPKENITQTQTIRFKIIPGSSFYGQLTNVLYSGFLEPGPIVKVEYPKFNNCNFIGQAQQSSPKGFSIKLTKVACSDGYEQSINAYAFQMKDLRPVWTSEIEHHYLPKAVIGGLDYIVNLTRIQNNNASVTDTQNGGVVQQSTLVDKILADELARYGTEYVMNPQALVVIFY